MLVCWVKLYNNISNILCRKFLSLLEHDGSYSESMVYVVQLQGKLHSEIWHVSNLSYMGQEFNVQVSGFCRITNWICKLQIYNNMVIHLQHGHSAPLSMLRLSASQHVLVLNLTSETRHWSSCVDWCKVTWLDWCGYRQICLADLSGTVAALHCQLQVSNHSKNMESGKVCIAWCYWLMFFLFCIHCFMSDRLMKCMYSRHERQCHTW
jgi:hypothetical protein